MPYTLVYHPDVRSEDLPKISRNLRERIAHAIEARLGTELQLKGYWKLRVGDYRVVFKMAGLEVRIYGIIHRREVYERIGKRFME